MTTTIPNLKHLRNSMLSLFQERNPPQPSPLTPTQRFMVSDLKNMILEKDGKGQVGFAHWEVRMLKDTRTILLMSLIGKRERFILVGPRGSLQQLSSKDDMAQMAIDRALDEQELGLA